MTQVIAPPYIECPDDIRCGQTVTKMILHHFMPDKEWSWGDVDEICSYVDGMWTWSEATAASLAEIGFDVACYTDLDAAAYAAAPDEYYRNKYGEDQYPFFLKYNDREASVAIMNRYLANKNIKTFIRPWTLEDAKKLLNEGYLLMAWVNPAVFYSRSSGAGGHFVLVYGYEEKNDIFIFHDGGSLITTEDGESYESNRWKVGRIGTQHFMKAAQDGNSEGGSSLTAFRLNK